MEAEVPEDTIPEEPEEHYELSPEEATGFGKSPVQAGVPGFFNRGKVLKAICISFAVVVGGGLILNISREKKKTSDAPANERAARPPQDLIRQLERAQRQSEERAAGENDAPGAALDDIQVSLEPDSPAAFLAQPQAVSRAPVPATAPPSPPAPQSGGYAGGSGRQADPLLAAYVSPLVPPVQGNLFLRNVPADQQASGPGAQGGYSSAYEEYRRTLLGDQAAARAAYPAPQDPYALQNAQDNKQSFYQGGGQAEGAGVYLDDSSLWIGTVIPAVLITAINTDLPGNTLARVTENIHDSKTGRNLLIPQGTILVARYNSSVSYAQHRVQIVWDTIIRPDGFLLELQGANGVDRKGMAGIEAEYHENWFEYLKAAGIIAMFSIANSEMTESVAKYASDSAAGSAAQANAEFVNQMGGTIVNRAMNIQPTLTVDNGTVINVMLNQTVSLPPVAPYPVTRKYIK